MRVTNLSRLSFISLCAVLATASFAVEPLEDMNHGPYVPGLGLEAPPVVFISDATIVRQVNISGSGNDMLNDAANEPSIWVNPANHNQIQIGWRQFDNIGTNFRQAGNAYSNDGGLTWHNNVVFTPGTFRSDPVLAGNSGGAVYYNSLQETFFDDVFRSLDGGATYNLQGPATGGDKQWMTCDTTTSSGSGFLYQLWSTAGNNYGGRQFSRSTDTVNWMDPINIPNQPVWGTLDTDRNGNLFICGSDGGSAFWCERSTNAKNPAVTPTFDQVTTVNMGGSVRFQIAGINPEGLLGQLWIAVDKSAGPNSGNIYLLSSLRRNASNPGDVMFSRSTNGGLTFSTGARVNDDPNGSGKYHWFGTLAVAPSGRLDAIWNDTRNAATNTTSQVYYTYSFNGGQTWATSVPLTSSFNQSLGYPSQNKMGDYMGVVSFDDKVNMAFAATFTGGQDVYFLKMDAPTLPVSGSIHLLDDVASTAGEVVTLEIRYNGNPIETRNVTLDASGHFSYNSQKLVAGTYQVLAKGRNWLKKSGSMTVSASGSTDANLSLLNGDADGDNEIGPGDFGAISSGYGAATGDANYVRGTDLDGDGEIGPGDFGILSSNYGISGDN